MTIMTKPHTLLTAPELWLILYLLLSVCIQCLWGNIDTEKLAFPAGAVIGGAAVALLYVLYREKGQSDWVRRLRSPRMSCWLLALVAGWCVVGGSLPSASSFPTSWPFVALLISPIWLLSSSTASATSPSGATVLSCLSMPVCGLRSSVGWQELATQWR